MSEETRVKIDLLDTEIVLQIRPADLEVVDEYCEEYKKGTAMPPIVAFRDGPYLWLADGLKRSLGAKGAGFEEINCTLLEGSKEDAIEYAAGANHNHGVPRDNKTKANCVSLLLRQDKWNKASDRAIADIAHVSHTLVSNVRKSLGIGRPDKTKGKDGKDRKTKKTREPGDDTGNTKAKPIANGEVAYSWQPFTAGVGNLIKQIDEIGRPYNAHNSKEANELRSILGDFSKEVGAWYSNISGNKPPKL
jgi:hypothetical protein